MAPRTVVRQTELNVNATTADPAGTAIDASNGHYVDCSDRGREMERMFLRIANTAGATKVATVVAGDDPPAELASMGPLAVSVDAGAVRFVGPLTSARFVKYGKRVHIDVEAGMTGTITAFAVPRT